MAPENGVHITSNFRVFSSSYICFVMFGNSYLLLIVRFMNVRALRVMTRYKVKIELSKDWAHIILRGFCWIALQTGAGVELLFSA